MADKKQKLEDTENVLKAYTAERDCIAAQLKQYGFHDLTISEFLSHADSGMANHLLDCFMSNKVLALRADVRSRRAAIELKYLLKRGFTRGEALRLVGSDIDYIIPKSEGSEDDAD